MDAEPVIGQTPVDVTGDPDQADHPAVYELENAATDPDGVLLDAMRDVAPRAGHQPPPDASADVVRARFARFLPPGCDAGQTAT